MGDMDYLKYLIKHRGLSIEEVATVLGMSKQAFYRKLNGKIEWYLKDIRSLRDLLEMGDGDLKKVFAL